MNKEGKIVGGAALGFVLLAPFIALFGALFRAVVLVWPTMLFFGAVHSHLDFVPALGLTATFTVLALLSLLIPTSVSTSTTTKS